MTAPMAAPQLENLLKAVRDFRAALKKLLELFELNRGTPTQRRYLPAAFPKEGADQAKVEKRKAAVAVAAGKARRATPLTNVYVGYQVPGIDLHMVDPIVGWATILQPNPLLEPHDIHEAVDQMINQIEVLIEESAAQASPDERHVVTTPMPARPRVFVGSSSEGLEVANALQVLLDHDCEVRIWTQGVFSPGGYTLKSLADSAQGFDFAILVVSPDDTTVSRGIEKRSTRDNVIFELGLFMGALGHERTFMVYDRTKPPDLPSDLAGVTPADYQLHTDGDLLSSLGAPTTLIRGAIRKLGPRPRVAQIDMEWAERAGKIMAQAIFAAPPAQRPSLLERLQQSGAPAGITHPAEMSLDYETEVDGVLRNLVSSRQLRGFQIIDAPGSGTSTSENVRECPDGRRVYVDGSRDFFIMNDMEVITPTLRVRAQMLQESPLYGGLILVARNIPEDIRTQVVRDMAEDPETTGAVRVVEYQAKQDIALIVDAVLEIADAPFPGGTSAYSAWVMETLREEVRSGAASRYIQRSDQFLRLPISSHFDGAFERIADGKLIMVGIRENLFSDDPAEGSRKLRQDLQELYESESLVARVGGVLLVTEFLPEAAVKSFVEQVDQAKSSVAVVFADIDGVDSKERLIRALHQAALQPGQEYAY